MKKISAALIAAVLLVPLYAGTQSAVAEPGDPGVDNGQRYRPDQPNRPGGYEAEIVTTPEQGAIESARTRTWARQGTPLTRADVQAWVDGVTPHMSDAAARAAALPYPTPGLARKVSGSQERIGARASTGIVWRGPHCQSKWYDGEDVYGRACSTYYKEGASDRVVTFSTENIASGHGENADSPGSGDCSLNCDYLKSIGSAGVSPTGRGIEIYSWAPRAEETIKDSCRNVTTSSTFGSTTVSKTDTVCPDKLSPYKVTSVSSGSRWIGSAKGWRGAHSVNVGQWDKTVGEWSSWNSMYISWD